MSDTDRDDLREAAFDAGLAEGMRQAAVEVRRWQERCRQLRVTGQTRETAFRDAVRRADDLACAFEDCRSSYIRLRCDCWPHLDFGDLEAREMKLRGESA